MTLLDENREEIRITDDLSSMTLPIGNLCKKPLPTIGTVTPSHNICWASQAPKQYFTHLSTYHNH